MASLLPGPNMCGGSEKSEALDNADEPSRRRSDTSSLISRAMTKASTVLKPVQWTTTLSEMFSFGQDDSGLIVRKLEECRTGYPRLATFLDSDENFMIYRRFGYIQARLLLDKQNELQCLEEYLDDQDKYEQDFNLQNAEPNPEEPSYRKKLLQQIETKYCEYAKLLNAARDIMSMRRPTETEYRSVSNFCHNEPRALSDIDQRWIYCKEDMVTLRPGRDHAWLDNAIERGLKMFNCKFIEHIFCSKETRRKSQGPEVYYTRSRIEGLAAGIITFMILVLLVVPTYVLYHLTNDFAQGPQTTALCIGVLIVFTLTFSAVLSLFTRARRHEILAAAAAYCAVLVVFLGNVPRPV